ncbi:MAG: DUF1868 domain-containing protein [Chloroflexaceae bacterium]|nr:DUF1868 domain-containing protein [Chloroflexaceae bacterium]
MDETYQAYVNRVARLTLPATYQSQLENLQASPKFVAGQAVAFPGFSAISPPYQDDSDNGTFYGELARYQQQLLDSLGEVATAVPVASFHLTLADLIWDSDYRAVVQENPQFDEQLQQRVGESFHQCQPLLKGGDPVCWQVLGIMLRPRAIALCLVPQNESSYEKVLQVRRSIYQNAAVIALGIEQQYHFTAHITMAYFSQSGANLDSQRLSEALMSLNDQFLLREALVLRVKRVELRKFDDMTLYYRKADWPVLFFE